jgi:hypothetical protein
MNKRTKICAASALVFASSHSFAADVTIDIQNLTQGMYFTPIAAVAHTLTQVCLKWVKKQALKFKKWRRVVV